MNAEIDPTPILNILRRPVAQVFQLLRLSSMQSGRDGKSCIHAHDSGVEVELGHAFKAARRTFFDAHAASFAVVDQNFVHAVRTLRPRNAGLRADEIAVVASVAGAAAETTVGLFDCLLFRKRLNHFLLRFAPARRGVQAVDGWVQPTPHSGL